MRKMAASCTRKNIPTALFIEIDLEGTMAEETLLGYAWGQRGGAPEAGAAVGLALGVLFGWILGWQPDDRR